MTGTHSWSPALSGSLTQLVDDLVERQPDSVALIEVGDRPRSLSWAQLRSEADRISTALLDLGVQPGESVAFQLPNWTECVTVTLGVLQIGAVVAPVMPVFGARETAMVLARARARVLIVPESFRGRRYAEELPAVLHEAAAGDLSLRVAHVLVVGALDPSGALRSGATLSGLPQDVATRPAGQQFLATRPAGSPVAPLELPQDPLELPQDPLELPQHVATRPDGQQFLATRGASAAGWQVRDFDAAVAGDEQGGHDELGRQGGHGEQGAHGGQGGHDEQGAHDRQGGHDEQGRQGAHDGQGGRRRIAARRPDADDVAQLLFTSGTTGEPKGVQHTHRTLGLAAAMEVAHLELTSDDRVYIPSPLAHQTGFLYGLLLSWRLGTAAVVQPIWDARTSLDQAFRASGARFVQAATPFLMDLVAAVDGGAPAPESLRIFVATGAAVPRELAERASRVLDTAVCGAFGTTETCLGTLSSPADLPGSAWGSDGRPLAGIRIRIVDDEGSELPAGHEGHYELHSPTMFLGYLDRPDLTADAFTADGWYRTGDLAVVDESGFLHITGRVKDVINRGGEKVPVVEIENLLFRHPLVKDVAIVAMPDPRLGERACAFVVPAEAREPLGFEAMQQYLADSRVSKYYWPERLELIAELPRNPVGKIQKNLLRERAAALVASPESDPEPDPEAETMECATA